MNGFKEFFTETYVLDLFMEVSSLAQTLKQHQDPELVKTVKGFVRAGLDPIPFFSEPMGRKLLDRYVNFFTYQIFQDSNDSVTLQKTLSDERNRQNAGNRIRTQVRNGYWGRWGDYFVAMGERMAGKLNNLGYTSQIADQESADWHEELATRERGKPDQEAKVFLTLDHLGSEWAGWKWVDLEKGYCSQEAKAMGHCGNSGAGQGDNIVSLRDSEGYAHLTFIINDGSLGESKGRANNKPSQKYHKPIMELLKSKHIETIKGGGYAPENNFDFHDLHDDHKKELDHKPNINDPFNHMVEKYSSDPKKMVGAMNEFFDSTSFQGFDGKNFSLESFGGHIQKRRRQDGKTIDAWVGRFEEIEEASKGWGHEINVGWLDNMWPEDTYHGMGSGELIDNLNSENKDQIAEYLKGKVKDFEEYDLDDLIAEDDDIMQALNWSAEDAQRSGNEAEAHASVTRQLADQDEHGFFIDFQSDPWALKISLDNVKELHKEIRDDNYIPVEGHVGLKYDEPQNGYFGPFDDSHYNEMVSERLHEVIS